MKASGALPVLDNASAIPERPPFVVSEVEGTRPFEVALAEIAAQHGRRPGAGVAMQLSPGSRPGLASDPCASTDPATSLARRKSRGQRDTDAQGTPLAFAGADQVGLQPQVQSLQPQVAMWHGPPVPGAGSPPEASDPGSRGAAPTSGTPLAAAATAREMEAALKLGPAAVAASGLAIERTQVKVTRQETHFGPIQSSDPQAQRSIIMPGEDGGPQSGPRVGRPASSQETTPPLQSSATDAGPSRVAAIPMHEASQSRADPALGPVGMQVLDAMLESSLPAAETNSGLRDTPASLPEGMMPGQLLRVIKIQLSPGSLGLVNVVLARNEASLRIRLEAELAETAGSLELDRTALVERMATSGYNLNELVIGRLVPPDSGTTASGQDASAQGTSRHMMFAGSDPMHRGARHPGENQDGSRMGGPDVRVAPAPPVVTPADERTSVSAGERFLGLRALRSV